MAGISKAFQNALLGRDQSVVSTLVTYNAKAERVSMKKLIESLSASGVLAMSSSTKGGHKKLYAWGGSYSWSGRHRRLGQASCRLWARLFGCVTSSATAVDITGIVRSRVNPTGQRHFLRPNSGTAALLEQLPPFVRKWYIRYISNGRKRWTAEEVAELESGEGQTQTAGLCTSYSRTTSICEKLRPGEVASIGATPRADGEGETPPSVRERRKNGTASEGEKKERDNYPQPGDLKTNCTRYPSKREAEPAHAAPTHTHTSLSLSL